jgi:DNA-binding NarL/FixJ family response regulator
MTTIVLADDHPIVRRGLRTLLEAETDFQVVGEAGDGIEAVRLTERLKPDVVVVDLMMPGMTGLEVTRQVASRVPRTQIIVLSMYDSDAYVREAVRGGAGGYVLKEASPSDLVSAVRAVAGGQRYLSPALSQRAVEAYVERARAAPPTPHETLSNREREVLKLAAEGRTSTEIAERLNLSPRTVETHRASLLRKLGLRSQSDLIRYAIRQGILPLEPPATDLSARPPA